MKIFFTIIALPITTIISGICFLFVLLFESNFKEKDGMGAFERIRIESRTLLLNEAWGKAPYVFKGIASLIIYYFMFS